MKLPPFLFLKLIALSGISLFSRCTPSAPPDLGKTGNDTIIQRDTMVRVLAGMHLAEAALIHMRNQGVRPEDSAFTYYQRIYAKFDVTPEKVEKSLKYYQSDQTAFIKMYDEALTELSKMQSREENR
ncbi:MAG: DUF4296 domain-containing protein [Bacteroidetes bacterium]|nr:DUF4296 domain-containing protein [Bacteroidota bacterium]